MLFEIIIQKNNLKKVFIKNKQRNGVIQIAKTKSIFAIILEIHFK